MTTTSEEEDSEPSNDSVGVHKVHGGNQFGDAYSAMVSVFDAAVEVEVECDRDRDRDRDCEGGETQREAEWECGFNDAKMTE